MMLECKDSKVVRSNPIVNCVRKPRNDVLPDVSSKHSVKLRISQNGLHGMIRSVKELRTQSRNSVFVKSGCLHEFSLGLWMINQAHPMALRAACMTSS